MKRATHNRSGYSRPFMLVALSGLAAAGVMVSTSAGHDEDWRKLNTAPPYVGPGYANGQWVNTDGTPAEPPATPTDNANVTLLSQITLGQFGTFSGTSQGNASDCWGYTSPSGREYAIIGLQKGFAVVEITNPASPTIISYIPGATSTWHDVKVIGSYAYGVSEGGLGVQVINLTNVDAGAAPLVQNKQQGGHSSTHNIAANTDTGYLYLCGANIANGGLVALTTANPSDPIIAGQWNDRYVHDAQVVSFTTGPNAGKEIAYCANETRVDIVDVTNKASMVTIGTSFYPQTGYTHQGWLSGDRKYWYANDELDEQSGLVPTTGSRIFNVENLNSPFYVGMYTSGEVSIDHNNYWHNGFIYQANYTSGLQVFDACIPTAPQRVAWYDTSGQSGNSFNGAWSVYPFFPSGTVIISDIQGGLFVFEVDPAATSGLAVAFSGATPSQLPPQTPTTIKAEVITCNATVQDVTLNVSIDGGAAVQVPMTLSGGNIYEAAIPGTPCFSDVAYWVTAESTAGGTASGPTANASVFTGLNTTFSDNFETNNGWAVANVGATSGDWQRGVPVNDPNWEYDPASDSDGSGQCYLTQNQTGNTDVDDGSVQLTSPVLDMTGPNLSVSYDYFINMTNPSGTDRLRVEVNNNNGVGAWTILVDHGSSNGLDWATHSFTADDLAAVGVTPTATMRLRFTANDANPQSIVEAGIDAIKVSGVVCDNPCYADCDQNGSLDFFDFLCFQNEFGAGTAFADCDGSGTLDFFDFLCFQNAFSAGCP